MAEIIVTVGLEVAKCLVPSIRSEISHMHKNKKNFKSLKAEVEKLKGISTSIQHKVDEAKRNGEEIEENVQRWLERANKIINEEVVKFTEDEETAAKKRCFKGLCPDLKTRYQLSKESVRQLKAVVKHREAGNFVTISYRTSPKDPRLSNKNYMAFESRESILNDILCAISNPDFHIIGIYGMGGVGKTTLAKEVAKQAERSKLFDRVAFASVNQSPDIKNIQGEIADILDLSLTNMETPSGRAAKLCKRLKKEKNILLILDDIWASLDLEAVGIPLGVDHKGCKVLLTARSVEVLSGKMNSQRNFEVGILNNKEAWSLFKNTAGNYIEDREFQPVATEVAKKCAGLPIAIVTVARALRNKRLFVWEDALQQLRRSSSESIEGIHATIELSYNHLESEELKKTFFLIGYSFVKSIDVLLTYGMGLGLFEGINKVEEAQARVRTLVQKLKDSCMLLDSNNGEDFSMHDVVRGATLSIASRKHQVFAMRNVSNDQWKWPDETILKSYSSVVLDNIQSSYEFPQVLECPQLKFFRARWFKIFIMRRTDCRSFKFPEDFFARMIELRVLDLSFANSRSLPSSIRLLTNLRTLRLECYDNIDGLAVIGDLRKLEILRLNCIDKLPVEIGQLTQLKSLDLRGWWQINVIPSNIIARLSHLEELYLGNFHKWAMEGLDNEERNASLDELHHLSYLNSLQIRVKNTNTLPRDLSFFKKLERYEIFIGDGWSWTTSSGISRKINLKLNNAHICIDMGHILQLKRMEDLGLDGWMNIKNVFYGLDNEGISQLKCLQVKNNPNLFCIVEYSNNNNGAVIELSQLRSLKLHSLPQLTSFCSKLKTQQNEIVNLEDDIDVPRTFFNEKVALPYLDTLKLCKINVERIWQNQVVALSCGIQNLTRLTVRTCRNLRCLFSSSIASSFDQLRYLKICKCPLLEEIVCLDDGLREEGRKNAMFPRLEFLKMEGLKNLTKFYSGEDHIEFSSVKELEIAKCPEWTEFMVKNVSTNLTENPTPFFNEKVAFPSLEKIAISCMDNLKMIVQPQLAHEILFRKLKSMKVESCDQLKSLTLCGVDSQLEQIDIRGCGVEEIVLVGNEVAEQTNLRFPFPMVISLRLYDLPNLTTLFPAEQPLFKVFPNLKELFVRGKSIATMIWQFSEDSLCRLKYVNVNLDGTTVISSLDFLQRFLNRNKLVIDGGRHIDELKRSKKDTSKTLINNLNKCSDLKHILKEESNMNNLVDLKVRDCDNLINIIPSFTSFQNLTTLVVLNCKGLENIVTFSAVKSLLRVRHMRIDQCNTITEIVADEGEATKDGIIFRELKKLSLIRLKSLKSFCSGNYTIKFPALQEFIVGDCPKMMIFCGGELSTPNLNKVKLYQRDEDGRWEGDLNTIIQQLHKKKEKDKEVWLNCNLGYEEDTERSNKAYYIEASDLWTDDDVRDMEEDAEGSGNEEVQSCKEDLGQPSTQHLE